MGETMKKNKQYGRNKLCIFFFLSYFFSIHSSNRMVGDGRGPAPSLAFAALGPTQISFSRTLFSTVDGTGSLKGQDTLAVTFARLSPAPGVTSSPATHCLRILQSVMSFSLFDHRDVDERLPTGTRKLERLSLVLISFSVL